jgi:hypothetical protein
VNYRPWLAEQPLRQMDGLPGEAFDVLARLMARICADPYDPLLSVTLRDEDPARRIADIGGGGFIEFIVDDDAGLVRVYALVWIG